MSEKKKISILGSTGSIGKQALEVIENLSDKFELLALGAGSNIKEICGQIEKFHPQTISVKNEKDADLIAKKYTELTVLCGDEGLKQIASNKNNDMVLVSVAGKSGLYPTIEALKNKIPVALANKETLVTAGDIVMKIAQENNTPIIPVDSEHSAIHQCIKHQNQVRKLIITGSGGPFREKTIADMEKATIEATLAHPNWSMGAKITVDSATLMNKGLEVIEAHHLFNMAYSDIEVVIHPQSIIHSAIELNDGSVLAQMGLPSMHIPIQYALCYPERYEGIKTNTLDFTQISKLEFEKPDLNKFPCLRLAFEAGEKGGTYPAVLNAANEEAVYAFLDEKIKLTDIAKIVEKILSNHKNIENPSLEDITETDLHTRELTKNIYQKSK